MMEAAAADSQFIMLKQRSQQVQTALEAVQSHVQFLEEEVAQFLDDYYAQVGAAFEQLTALQAECAAVQRGCFDVPSAPVSPASSPMPARDDITTKQLFRNMARECHPDRAEGNADLMQTLNAAYAQQNLPEMWQVKWELERQKQGGQLSHRQRLELLQAQQAHMQETLAALEQREHDIKASEAFALMQHARLMECCGQDFIAMVKGRVQQQTEQAKRDLRAAKHQARYWGHVSTKQAENLP